MVHSLLLSFNSFPLYSLHRLIHSVVVMGLSMNTQGILVNQTKEWGGEGLDSGFLPDRVA